jgi:hypothetical protein
MTPAQQQREVELLEPFQQRRMARLVLAGWRFQQDGQWWKAISKDGMIEHNLAFLDHCINRTWYAAVSRGEIYVDGLRECFK